MAVCVNICKSVNICKKSILVWCERVGSRQTAAPDGTILYYEYIFDPRTKLYA